MEKFFLSLPFQTTCDCIPRAPTKLIICSTLYQAHVWCLALTDPGIKHPKNRQGGSENWVTPF